MKGTSRWARPCSTVAHYTAAGWLPDQAGEEEFVDLVTRGASEGLPEILEEDAEYRVLTDPDRLFELWLYSAAGQIRGVVPFVRGDHEWDVLVDELLPRVTGGLGLVKARVVDPVPTPTPVCFELPDFSRIQPDDVGGVRPARVTGLAYQARVLRGRERNRFQPGLDSFGMRGDHSIPVGEGSRCDVLVHGTVTTTREVQNRLSGVSVQLVGLDCGGLPLSVAISPEALEDPLDVGDPLEGAFWLVGRILRRSGPGHVTQALSPPPRP